MTQLLKVSRPQFLIGILGLFAFGAQWALLSGAPFSWKLLLTGYLAIATAQLSVHFNNDYFDAGHDQTGSSTFISGGSGVMVEHPELKRLALIASLVLLLISLLLGMVLMRLHAHPWLMMGFVLLGNMAGWAYSAPPVRSSARGLGELCYVLTGGFLVPGMGYAVLRGGLDANAASMLFPLLPVRPGEHDYGADPGCGSRLAE